MKKKYLKVYLSKEQNKYYDAIKWLLFGPRRHGKTYLLAIIYIEKALASPGEIFRPRDHQSQLMGDKELLYVIKSIAERIKGRWYFENEAFGYIGSNKDLVSFALNHIFINE